MTRPVNGLKSVLDEGPQSKRERELRLG